MCCTQQLAVSPTKTLGVLHIPQLKLGASFMKQVIMLIAVVISASAISTFSPIGMWSSNGMKMCVCVCVCVCACVHEHACTGIVQNKPICGHSSVMDT